MWSCTEWRPTETIYTRVTSVFGMPPLAGGKGTDQSVSILRKSFQKIGWSWLSPWVVQTRAGIKLDLRCVTARQWKHEVREGLRFSLWRQAEKRRADMVGLCEGGGIDRPATCKLLRSPKLAPARKGMLRSILSGAVRVGHRLGELRSSGGACQFCKLGEIENA